jgi:hypothetical protein
LAPGDKCRSTPAAGEGGELTGCQSSQARGDIVTNVFDILMMLVHTGARIRTEAEFRNLFAAGLRLTRVIPTPSPNSILEGMRE